MPVITRTIIAKQPIIIPIANDGKRDLWEILVAFVVNDAFSFIDDDTTDVGIVVICLIGVTQLPLTRRGLLLKPHVVTTWIFKNKYKHFHYKKSSAQLES